MPNNTTLNPGQGGDTIASEDILGVKIQRNKMVIGNFGVDGGDISQTNPMPISGMVAIDANSFLEILLALKDVGITDSLPSGNNLIGRVLVDTSGGAVPISLDISSLAKDNTIQALSDISNTLYDLVSSLQVLSTARDVNGALRANIINTPNVGTVDTLSNVAGLQGWNTSSIVSNTTNNVATIANINNCVG